MNRNHRTAHRILWLLLVPLLLFFVFLAQNSEPNKTPPTEQVPHLSGPQPSSVGELP
jgi:hypothetical protein